MGEGVTRRGQAVVVILHDLAVTVTPGIMLQQQGYDSRKRAMGSRAMLLYEQVAEPARALAEPTALIDVFNVLTPSAIGVRRTDHCVMVPAKSVSMLVGLGQNVPTRHQMDECAFCPRKDTCPSALLCPGHPATTGPYRPA